jgi:hypothetical protein
LLLSSVIRSLTDCLSGYLVPKRANTILSLANGLFAPQRNLLLEATLAVIMALPMRTKCWVMARKPTGLPTYSGGDPTFVLETRELPELKSGQVLVESLYLSNDPSQRTWMSSPLPEKRHYSKALSVLGSNKRPNRAYKFRSEHGCMHYLYFPHLLVHLLAMSAWIWLKIRNPTDTRCFQCL